MTRQLRVGYGRLAVGVLAVVATTWGAGTAIAAPGDAATTVRVASASTSTGASTPSATGTPAPGTPIPSGTGSDGTGTSSTTCYQPPYGTGATAPLDPSTFEDGTLGNWVPDTGVTLTNTTQVAASGERSLRADGVTGTSGLRLPSSSTPVQGANWQRVTAKVRLAPGSAPAYVQLTPDSAYTSVPGVARVTADGWTTITAWFFPGTLYWDAFCNGQMYGGSYPVMSSLKVLSAAACGQAAAGPVTLFVDDVAITQVTSTPVNYTSPPEPASSPQCSGPSPVTSTTPPTPVCTARYDSDGRWPGGHLGHLRVVNTSSSTSRSPWVITWRFPGNQRITSLWGSGGYRQSGRQVTVTGPARSVVAAGGAVDVGFVASGAPGALQAVTLDGHPCGVTTG